MRLLILTQKIDKNDPILGFFHRWIEEFSKHCERVTVICLERGAYNLPQNVRVYSLGKEEENFQFSIFNFQKVKYIWRFYKYIWSLRNDYDSVFVHMNPEYVLLGSLFWKILGKKIALWYVHRETNFKLRLAVLLSNVVLTSASSSLNIKNPKIRIVGHGIDTDTYKYERGASNGKILSVGRITPIKHLDFIMSIVSSLPMSGVFIGEPVTSQDEKYMRDLEGKRAKNIEFKGSLKPAEIAHEYKTAFASINATPTGGIDKVVLESFASGCPCFTSNESFRDILREHADLFIFDFLNSEDVVDKIQKFNNLSDRDKILYEISEHVSNEYSIQKIVEKIVKTYE